MRSSKTLAYAMLALGCSLPAVGHATRCSGTNINNTLMWEPKEIAKGTSVVAFRATSVILNHDTKSPFHLAAGECTGSFFTSPDGRIQGNGTCARKDKDGDVLTEEWTGASDGKSPVKGTSRVLGGTGKFAGYSYTGQWESVPLLPGRLAAVHWAGECKP